jgi:uncharacterized protein YndB with AHSA1/START domain
VFRLDRTWPFALPAGELWAALTRTEEFPLWWPWLVTFELDGGGGRGLRAGVSARVVVRAPVPWALRLTVDVARVEEGRLVEAMVSGDLSGPARLEVGAGVVGASTARLVWELTPASPLLRATARAARPLLELGQRWVLDTGVAQFRRRALGDH